MPTSLHSGFLRNGLTLEQSMPPLGASFARDYLLNNLLHLADEYGQVRMAFSTSDYFEPAKTVAGNTYYLAATSGPFGIPLRQDGSAYRMRVRVGGASSNVAGTATFRVIVCPPLIANTIATTSNPGVDYVFQASTTSTSAAWLTGTTLGPLADATLITIDAETARSWLTTSNTLSDIGGDPATVDQCVVAVHIFAKISSNAYSPRLYAGYAAEYVGE
jgi:hypothetical protein